VQEERVPVSQTERFQADQVGLHPTPHLTNSARDLIPGPFPPPDQELDPAIRSARVNYPPTLWRDKLTVFAAATYKSLPTELITTVAGGLGSYLDDLAADEGAIPAGRSTGPPVRAIPPPKTYYQAGRAPQICEVCGRDDFAPATGKSTTGDGLELDFLLLGLGIYDGIEKPER